jgi:short-subunit dehydrogenase
MNKHALVTGASSGIGLSITRLLLNKGYQVTGISRRGIIEQEQPLFTPVSLDLADSKQTELTLKKLLAGNHFDCFIHSAGYGDFGSIEQFSVKRIERAIRVNLTSALIICSLLIPYFRARKAGRVILMGSESGLVAGRKSALYSATKFGLRGFSQALRDDCASDNIQVSLINPGMVRSPFFDKLSFAPADSRENAITTEQVAELVYFILNSDDNIVFDEIELSPRVKSINFSPSRSAPE